jgi:hypothetical protein
MAGPLMNTPTPRPRARPVDTFSRPDVQEPPENSQLSQLAETLSDVEPTLQRYVKKEHEQ